jgi:hypothetical protein
MRRGLMGVVVAVATAALVGAMIASPASAADVQSVSWSSVASRPDGWATVGSRTPLRNEWNATPAASGQMRVGPGDTGGQTETLIDVPIPGVLAGAVVNTASLNLTVTGSSPCPAAAIAAYAPNATLTSHNATWAHWSAQRLGPVLDREAGSQCPFPAIGFDVTSAVAAAARAGKTTQTFVLKSIDPAAWREFSPSSPVLAITYNHGPERPTGLTTSPTTTCAANPPTAIRIGSITLQATLSDPDGNILGAQFELYKKGSRTPLATTDPELLTDASGSFSRWVLPQVTFEDAADADGLTDFTWRVRSTDFQQTSPWSAVCGFTVDTQRPNAPTLTVPEDGVLNSPITIHITPPVTGPTPARYYYLLNGGTADGTVAAASDGSADLTVTPDRNTNTLTVTSMSPGGNFGGEVSVTFNVTIPPPPPTAAANDFDGDSHTDLLVAGGEHGVPSGLWLVRGDGTGGFAGPATDIGANGDGFDAGQPSDFDGAQVVPGRYAGGSQQDVFTYWPAGDKAGTGVELRGTGDGTAIQPTPYDTATDTPLGYLSDWDNNYPLQLVNASTAGDDNTPYPNLVGISGTSGAYHLAYYSCLWSQSVCTWYYDMPNATPTGGTDWDTWTLASAVLDGHTTLLLWQPSTGKLYAWDDVTTDPDTMSLRYSQHQLADDWNTGQSLTLQGADINSDGTADLWTIGDGAIATAWLVTGLGTITAQPSHTIATP